MAETRDASEVFLIQGGNPAGLSRGDHELAGPVWIPGAQVAESEALVAVGGLTDQIQAHENGPPGPELAETCRLDDGSFGRFQVIGEADDAFLLGHLTVKSP
jgi:hypothetical protein